METSSAAGAASAAGAGIAATMVVVGAKRVVRIVVICMVDAVLVLGMQISLASVKGVRTLQ